MNSGNPCFLSPWQRHNMSCVIVQFASSSWSWRIRMRTDGSWNHRMHRWLTNQLGKTSVTRNCAKLTLTTYIFPIMELWDVPDCMGSFARAIKLQLVYHTLLIFMFHLLIFISKTQFSARWLKYKFCTRLNYARSRLQNVSPGLSGVFYTLWQRRLFSSWRLCFHQCQTLPLGNLRKSFQYFLQPAALYNPPFLVRDTTVQWFWVLGHLLILTLIDALWLFGRTKWITMGSR